MEEEKKSIFQEIREIAEVTAPIALLTLAAWWGFNRDVKREVYERQDGMCGEEGCEQPIDEYHHRVPERALLKRGIKGKNTAANCVGLCFDHHKHKWDELMMQGVFYPGVEMHDLDPNTYVVLSDLRRRK